MARRTRRNIGVIGLGIIGSRVTNVLREKGFHVFVWNRTPRPVPNFVGAPAEIAEMCDLIEIFVSDDQALLEVCRELAPSLEPRHIVVAHSTVAPHSMRDAANVVERRGARFIEAPFTGSKEAAAKGELLYYVGGDEKAIREVMPALEASGRRVMVIGEIGQATAIKIATNMITAASVAAAAEALALVYTVGLPVEKLLEAMRGNASFSKTLEMKLPKMINTDFEPHFSLKHMLKDIQIAARMGSSFHLELPVTGVTRDRLFDQMQLGRGDEDYSTVARKYFAGAQPPPPEEQALKLFEREVLPGELPVAHETMPDNSAPNLEGNFISVVQETAPQPGEPAPAPEPMASIPDFTPIAPAAPEQAESQKNDDEDEQPERSFLSRLLRREPK
jgi:3-hydroxyisobutyrate dehydrogenase-like beta-hydroxyacid dehydrogenase